MNIVLDAAGNPVCIVCGNLLQSMDSAYCDLCRNEYSDEPKKEKSMKQINLFKIKPYLKKKTIKHSPAYYK